MGSGDDGAGRGVAATGIGQIDDRPVSDRGCNPVSARRPRTVGPNRLAGVVSAIRRPELPLPDHWRRGQSGRCGWARCRAGRRVGHAGEDRPRRHHNLSAAWAVRADLLRRASRLSEAREAYAKAISLCTDAPLRRWLEARAAALPLH